MLYIIYILLLRYFIDERFNVWESLQIRDEYRQSPLVSWVESAQVAPA